MPTRYGQAAPWPAQVVMRRSEEKLKKSKQVAWKPLFDCQNRQKVMLRGAFGRDNLRKGCAPHKKMASGARIGIILLI
jgi:hypothetical protein